MNIFLNYQPVFKIYILMLSGLLMLSSCVPPPASLPESTYYTLDASIDPASGNIKAAADIYFFPEESVDTLWFLIHEDLNIEAIESSIVDEFATESWKPGMAGRIKKVIIPLLKTADAGEPVHLSWKYEGQLSNEHLTIGASAIYPRWTELPLESMWIPVDASLRKRFMFEAHIQLPDGFALISNGATGKTDLGWKIDSEIPGPDIPVIISNQFRLHQHQGKNDLPVSVYHAGASKETVDFIAEHSGDIIGHYDSLFIHGRLIDRDLRISISPLELEEASSYARPGFISFQHGVSPGINLFQLIAHETAHLWWFNAVDTQSRHNFLNESFAEYFSWLELRRVYGEEWFNKKLESARENAEELPGFDAFTLENNGLLSYIKGPVLLRQLHEKIGNEKFTSFFRRLLQKRTGTMEDMLAVLQEITNRPTAEWFEEKLFGPGVKY